MTLRSELRTKIIDMNKRVKHIINFDCFTLLFDIYLSEHNTAVLKFKTVLIFRERYNLNIAINRLIKRNTFMVIYILLTSFVKISI